MEDARTRQVVLLLVQTAVVFYQLCNFTAFVGLFMYLSLLVRAHLTAICSALTQQAADVDLRAIVRHHQEVLSFLQEMEAVYHPLLLLDFLPLVVVICLMIFVLISMEGVDLMFVQTLTLFVLYFLNVGTFCFFGTQITSQAEAVALSAYGSGWQSRGRAFGGAVLLVLQRAQRPFALTAGKFAPVSITTFSSMMQDAFSYLMVMRSLIGSKDSTSPVGDGEEMSVAAGNHTLTL
ncbi:odorant receptor 4-like [Schistocerca americana]|uniref:odorant receptor 4-like n=1 Tax=Schistocerca americana TaxID=7009 RepID=UPI001F4FB043|nr:odorant receptor 4-like [Schistocerca americana]